MSEDDPFMIEEAHYKARLFLDKMAADGDRTDDLKNPAFVMFLEIERGGANESQQPDGTRGSCYQKARLYLGRLRLQGVKQAHPVKVGIRAAVAALELLAAST